MNENNEIKLIKVRNLISQFEKLHNQQSVKNKSAPITIKEKAPIGVYNKTNPPPIRDNYKEKQIESIENEIIEIQKQLDGVKNLNNDDFVNILIQQVMLLLKLSEIEPNGHNRIKELKGKCLKDIQESNTKLLILKNPTIIQAPIKKQIKEELIKPIVEEVKVRGFPFTRVEDEHDDPNYWLPRKAEEKIERHVSSNVEASGIAPVKNLKSFFENMANEADDTPKPTNRADFNILKRTNSISLQQTAYPFFGVQKIASDDSTLEESASEDTLSSSLSSEGFGSAQTVFHYPIETNDLGAIETPIETPEIYEQHFDTNKDSAFVVEVIEGRGDDCIQLIDDDDYNEEFESTKETFEEIDEEFKSIVDEEIINGINENAELKTVEDVFEVTIKEYKKDDLSVQSFDELYASTNFSENSNNDAFDELCESVDTTQTIEDIVETIKDISTDDSNLQELDNLLFFNASKKLNFLLEQVMICSKMVHHFKENPADIEDFICGTLNDLDKFDDLSDEHLRKAKVDGIKDLNKCLVVFNEKMYS